MRPQVQFHMVCVRVEICPIGPRFWTNHSWEMKRTAESGRMRAKAEKEIHMIIFLQQSLLKREGLFWQKNNDGKRFITVNYFSLGIRYIYSNTQKRRWHSFLSLVICTKFACNHSISEVSLCLDILNEEHGRVILGEQRNRIKRNGIRDRQKKRAIHYSPPRVFRQWMWKQMRVISLPQQF